MCIYHNLPPGNRPDHPLDPRKKYPVNPRKKPLMDSREKPPMDPREKPPMDPREKLLMDRREKHPMDQREKPLLDPREKHHQCRLPDRRGSLAVEAAIFLPLFLVGMLTILFLIRCVAIQENVHHALADETGRLAAEAPLPVMSVTFKKDLLARLSEENSDRIRGIAVEPIRYRVSQTARGKRYTDLIGVSITYGAAPKLPSIFIGETAGGDTALTRAFTGWTQTGKPMPFSEMEKDEKGEIVWVFPRAGERYHGENCGYIKNNPREQLLTPGLRTRYQPCALCKPGDLEVGSLVYCFPSSGTAYHQGSCYQVDRYVISMDEEEAKKRGVTACAKCSGK